MIPDVAVGAVIAALVGAMISLVGLIVAKEAKVSEFRQAWIDELRSDLALFITHLNAMEDAGRIRFEHEKERFEKTRDGVAKHNEAYFNVALRLNPEESRSKSLKGTMVDLAKLVSDHSRDEAVFNRKKIAFIDLSNALLKAEWVRVRDGEKTYRVTKRFAIWAVVVLLVLMVVFAGLSHGQQLRKPFTAKSPTTAIQDRGKIPEKSLNISYQQATGEVSQGTRSSKTATSVPLENNTLEGHEAEGQLSSNASADPSARSIK